MTPLKKLFRYTDTISFEVSEELTKAVDQLSRFASKPVLQAMLAECSEPSLVGIVSKECVRLHKVTPLFGNIFKPIFFGKFHSQNGKTSLVGTFEMGLIGRVVISGFVFVTLAIQLLLLPGLSTDGIMVFGPTLFLIGGILFVLILKAFSKPQVSWIKRQIETVLR